jgi:hypothetical protein
MTYTFNRLRDKRGVRLKKPESIAGVTLDIDKNRHAFVFVGMNLFAEICVLEFEAHAAGLFLRGYETVGVDRVLYQEWFLEYEGKEA